MSDIIKRVNCIYILVRHYEVHVFTGDHWAAGTDANMFITMNGTRGDSGRRLLYKCLNNRVKFKRGQVGYSFFYCNIQVSPVTMRRLGSTNLIRDIRGTRTNEFRKNL